MMIVAEEILCSRTHEYVLEKDNNYYIGITSQFINSLGEIVFLELPEIGSEFIKGEVFATIQGVNSSMDLCMPIGGTVIDINEDVVANYDELAEKNWLIKIESNTASADAIDLLEYEDYLDLV